MDNMYLIDFMLFFFSDATATLLVISAHAPDSTDTCIAVLFIDSTQNEECATSLHPFHGWYGNECWSICRNIISLYVEKTMCVCVCVLADGSQTISFPIRKYVVWQQLNSMDPPAMNNKIIIICNNRRDACSHDNEKGPYAAHTNIKCFRAVRNRPSFH